MDIQACTRTEEKPFSGARAFFDTLTNRLASNEAMQMRHADLERMLEADGHELMRLLLQDHLDLRGPGEAATEVVSATGIRRPHERLRTRTMKSLFGKVVVPRLGYSAHEADTLFPKDADLNLPPELYSHGVQRRAATEVIKSSFDQAAAAIAMTTGTTVPKRQLEEITGRAAVDFDAFYEARSADSRREASKTGEILVLSTDGKGIVMRPESLRENTRKAAESHKTKGSKMLSQEARRNRKRMAQVATVFTIAPFVRCPEDIVTKLGPVRDATGAEATRPRPEHKRVWASVDKQPETVIGDMFAEAKRRDPGGTKLWTVLVDGLPNQLALIKKTAKRHDVRPTIIIDFIHVLQYVWKAGTALYGEGHRSIQGWVSKRLLEILRGNSSNVAAGMRRSATLRHTVDRRAVDRCANYLLKYRRYLRYDEYLAAGMPIATGVIEGACRHLINDRMDITGASWGLRNAEAILKLRALHSSDDFDSYWTFHENAEWVRNHDRLYAGPPPAIMPPLKVQLRLRLRLVQ